MADNKTQTLTGITEIETEHYSELIEFADSGTGNLLVFGAAGIGKTEIPIAYCKAKGIPYVYWNLSTQEAPDLVGIPVERDGNDRVHYLAAPYMPVRDLTPEPVVIIIDEVDKAKPELQNPLLEVLQFRSINGRQLNTRGIFLTANLPEEHAFSRPMSHALTNRCSVYKLRPDVELWQKWATSVRVNPLIVGYIASHQAQLLGKDSDDPTAYCNRSPRSWTLAARDIDRMQEASVDRQARAVAGRVGGKAAAEFKAWLEHYREVDPIVRSIIEGKIPSAAKNLTVDKALVCAISVSSHIRQAADRMRDKAGLQEGAKPTKEMIREVQRVAGNAAKFLVAIPPEYQFASVKSTLDAKFVVQHELLDVESLSEVYKSLHAVVASSGN